MAGTTTSSGLNNLLSDTNQVQTTLPSWMDTAQQDIVSKANAASASSPTFANTTAQNAVNTLQGSNNPFNQANATLNTIASGAANPWITDASGNVTPNTNTALGGLFKAQTNQLNQLLPTQTAGTEGAAIGSGNFGSLRGQTAVDTAKGNALAQLQAQQMQAALENQKTGEQAAAAQGNVGAQEVTADLTTGSAQMNAPFQGALNYANLINSINAPSTVSTQNKVSPLSLLGTLASAPQAGTSLLDNLFGKAAVGTPGQSGYVPGMQGVIPYLEKKFPSIFGSGSSSSSDSGAAVDPGRGSLPDPGSSVTIPEGAQDNGDGTYTVINNGQKEIWDNSGIISSEPVPE